MFLHYNDDKLVLCGGKHWMQLQKLGWYIDQNYSFSGLCIIWYMSLLGELTALASQFQILSEYFVKKNKKLSNFVYSIKAWSQQKL